MLFSWYTPGCVWLRGGEAVNSIEEYSLKYTARWPSGPLLHYNLVLAGAYKRLDNEMLSNYYDRDRSKSKSPKPMFYKSPSPQRSRWGGYYWTTELQEKSHQPGDLNERCVCVWSLKMKTDTLTTPTVIQSRVFSHIYCIFIIIIILLLTLNPNPSSAFSQSFSPGFPMSPNLCDMGSPR